MSVVKSTEIFGTVTLLYKTMSLGEFRSSLRFPNAVGDVVVRTKQ